MQVAASTRGPARVDRPPLVDRVTHSIQVLTDGIIVLTDSTIVLTKCMIVLTNCIVVLTHQRP